MTEHGFEVTFKKGEAIVSNSITGERIMVAKRDEGIYIIEEATEKASIAQEKVSSLQEWHNKFGHLNERDLKELARHKGIHGITLDKNEELQTCEVCIKGKQTQVSFKKSESQTKDILSIIHTDICGPMRCRSIGGSNILSHSSMISQGGAKSTF